MSQKRELQFAGVVEDIGGSLTEVSPLIGDRNVIAEIEKMWPDAWAQHPPNVRVYIGIEPEVPVQVGEGPLWAVHGFGGTDVTPADNPEITVGDLDLVDRLYDLDGRTVLLIVEDA